MKIAIFGNEYQQGTQEYVKKLLQKLLDRGVRVSIEQAYHHYLQQSADVGQLNLPSFRVGDKINADFSLSIGGDGTFLQTAHVAAPLGVPIMGVNAGRMGYLTTADVKEIDPIVNAIINGDYVVEKRSMLQLMPHGQEQLKGAYALNEISIQRLENSPISIEVKLGNKNLTSYLGDGLLVCTPTGSTAYNLSVGGPLLEPLTQCIAITPVSPHSLTMRPLVVRDDLGLTVTTTCRASHYRISVDGQAQDFPSGTAIAIHKAPIVAKVVELKGRDFIQALRDKLMWGRDA